MPQRDWTTITAKHLAARALAPEERARGHQARPRVARGLRSSGLGCQCVSGASVLFRMSQLKETHRRAFRVPETCAPRSDWSSAGWSGSGSTPPSMATTKSAPAPSGVVSAAPRRACAPLRLEGRLGFRVVTKLCATGTCHALEKPLRYLLISQQVQLEHFKCFEQGLGEIGTAFL